MVVLLLERRLVAIMEENLGNVLTLGNWEKFFFFN